MLRYFKPADCLQLLACCFASNAACFVSCLLGNVALGLQLAPSSPTAHSAAAGHSAAAAGAADLLLSGQHRGFNGTSAAAAQRTAHLCPQLPICWSRSSCTPCCFQSRHGAETAAQQIQARKTQGNRPGAVQHRHSAAAAAVAFG